jgi:hypothetical protein
VLWCYLEFQIWKEHLRTLDASQNVRHAVGSIHRPIDYRVPIPELPSLGTHVFERDEGVVALKFLREVKARGGSGVDGLGARLEFLSDAVRDEIIVREG